MGGNALQFTKTRRYQWDEFVYVRDYVVTKATWGGMGIGNVQYIPYYKSKTSFGDLDVLVNIGDRTMTQVREFITEQFSPNEIVRNGDTLSFNVHELQVDFICVRSTRDLDSALFYFGYNDMGNLLGKMFHRLNLKFGHTGLIKEFFNGQHKLSVELTRDPREILSVLGLSYERYEEGFNTLEDIFEYVTSSLMFDPNVYNLDELDHRTRVRDRKRTTIQHFREWVEARGLKYRLPIWSDTAADNWAFYYFADKGIAEKYAEWQDRINKELTAKSKLSGTDFMIITGLQGPELGKFINSFYNHYSCDENLNDFRLSRSREDLLKMVKDFADQTLI